MSYLLQLIKANALGDDLCSFLPEIIPGDLILDKRHLLPMRSISVHFPNFVALFPICFLLDTIDQVSKPQFQVSQKPLDYLLIKKDFIFLLYMQYCDL